ncbi:DUF4240 domain-containing protein [Cryptosporangium aurantiacum]|uniref:DUF4240 domain-containing protein n=1 Tax=Cryptosporangium aurantiacum TaxID=134849 RepID=A0A1M7TXX6_9ACTN|nr:DUF4240 domain-containing protein [Cryptosporangium aurantiacum]SHN75503.1 Protein of unknown function [Cryptosporangium aurantiacum]
MDEGGFWDVVAEAYAALECGWYDEDTPRDAVAVAWSSLLAERSADDVLDFAVHYERAMERARRPVTLAAAALLSGGAADDWYGRFAYEDRFAAFRSALVALGRTSFEAVIAEPDVLASLPDADAVERGDWDFFANLDAVPRDAYAAAGGDPGAFANAVAGQLGARPVRGVPPLRGEWHIDESTLATRFPKLAARFPDGVH